MWADLHWSYFSMFWKVRRNCRINFSAKLALIVFLEAYLESNFAVKTDSS